MKKLLFLIINISIVLLSFAMGQKKLTKALYEAAARGDIITAQQLLKAGANVNSKDSSNVTPLHVACQNNHAEMAKLLLEKGALVDETDSIIHETPLHLAVQEGNLAIANVLLEHGANVNSKSNLGLTPLHLACKNNNPAMTKLLLEKGAFTDEIDEKGWTPLHGAALYGYFSVANILLEGGANVNRKNRNSYALLHVACQGNNSDIVKLLLEKGAFIDETDENGWTPLHLAVQHSNFSLVDLLLEHGANILAKDKAGLMVIECSGQLEMFRAMELLKQGAPYPRTDLYQKMLEEKDFLGMLEGSSLFYKNYFKALIKGDTKGALAAIMQASVIDINEATERMNRLTALHWAVLQNNREVVEALVVHPLTLQILAPQLSTTISWYVNHPVDINCRDVDGRTPLMWAARLGYIHIYRDLKRAGAKHAFVDKKGKMALNYAADYRNINIIREMIVDGTLSAKPVTNSHPFES